MYYTNSNYEAFARPKNLKMLIKISIFNWIRFSFTSSSMFLIRDGQMKGENIHILEELDISGGSLDGINMEHHGFVVRGGREMENHFECLWDLFKYSIIRTT